MQKVLAYGFNFLELVLGPVWMLYYIIFGEIDTLGVVLLVGLGIPIFLLLFHFFVLFIYHLAADESWMKRKVSVVDYFRQPENLFFLKSLLFGIVMVVISLIILIIYSRIQS